MPCSRRPQAAPRPAPHSSHLLWLPPASGSITLGSIGTTALHALLLWLRLVEACSRGSRQPLLLCQHLADSGGGQQGGGHKACAVGGVALVFGVLGEWVEGWGGGVGKESP